jgi:hypothetical protein
MLQKPGVRPWRLGVGTNALEQESWIYVDISLLAPKGDPYWPRKEIPMQPAPPAIANECTGVRLA